MLTIGYKTEIGYRTVPVYNVAEWLAAHPGLSLELRFTPPGAAGYYVPGGVSVQDGVMLWTPDDTDTQTEGTGKVQLWARDPEAGIRGAVTGYIYTQVLASMHESVEPAPVLLPYMERVLDSAATINIAVDAAQEAADSAEKSADSIKRMTAEATSVPYTAPVRAEYDPTTGVMHFDIPEGKPGSGGGGGDVPTHLSQLVDDLGSRPVHTHQQYLTQHQSLAAYAKKTEIPAVPDWAMQAQKPSYTAFEVHALPDNTVIPAEYNDAEVRRLIGENADKIVQLKNDLTDLEQSIPTDAHINGLIDAKLTPIDALADDIAEVVGA